MNPTLTSRTSKHVSSRQSEQRSNLPRPSIPSPASTPEPEQIEDTEVQVEGQRQSETEHASMQGLAMAESGVQQFDASPGSEMQAYRTGQYHVAGRVEDSRDDTAPDGELNRPADGHEQMENTDPTSNVPSTTVAHQLYSVASYLPVSAQFPSVGLSNLSLASFSAPKISNITVGRTSSSHHKQFVNDGTLSSSKDERRRSTGYDKFTEGDQEKLMKSTSHGLSITPHVATYPDSDEESTVPAAYDQRIRYPSSSPDEHDMIVFASFSFLPSRTTQDWKTLLFIGYTAGLQVWDTTHLGEVHKILNLPRKGTIVSAGVLPTPAAPPAENATTDLYEKDRPLIAMIEDNELRILLIYSLFTHRAVKKLDFLGANVASFQSNSRFITVSTTTPLALHILCPRTFNVLHTISSAYLSPLSRRELTGSFHPVTSVYGQEDYTMKLDPAYPVFSLSSRLLAYASSAPNLSSPPLNPIFSHTRPSQSPSLHLGPLAVPMRLTQADIGAAALKVGGGLLSGMKALGGMAVAAARGDAHTPASSSERMSGLTTLFFSRSAPAASGKHERRHSYGSASNARRQTTDLDPSLPGSRSVNREAETTQPSASPSHTTAYVTVLDLQWLFSDGDKHEPKVITQFMTSDSQPITGLRFSEDGTCLSVIPRDGTVIRVFQIRPVPSFTRSSIPFGEHQQAVRDISEGIAHKRDFALRSDFVRNWVASRNNSSTDAADTELMDAERDDGIPAHIYDLRRGRTSGVIEDMTWAADGRWVAIGTRKRTVHVFATNPYGGKPDERSHLDGRVQNVDVLQPLSTEVTPIVRLRALRRPAAGQPLAPLTFTFVRSSPTSMPPSLLPLANAYPSPSSTRPSSAQSSPRKRPQSLSPRMPQRPTNFQDVLVFDPSDGILSLRRLTLSTRSAESNPSFMSSLPIPGGTSISLPGMRATHRMSASPPSPNGRLSGLSRMMERPTGLMAKDSVIATWNLKRDLDNWQEIKTAISDTRGDFEDRSQLHARTQWLSQAELSTSSNSPNILPGSIYLSHQFSFHALGEDYHALIRRSHFDIPTTKIDVRKEVEASAYASGHGESFVQAGTSPQAIRRARSSFDEPLASAVSAHLDYPGTSPTIIPMLPNGTPSARSGSFKAAIPIRTVAVGLSDGMNEGIGRLKREIGRVRSPRLLPRSDPSSVPLEFDEEDEDFLTGDERNTHERDDDTTSRGEGDSGGSISTPSTNITPLADNEAWDGWGPEDSRAIEEVERFDEISAAGFMDEEQVVPLRTSKRRDIF